MRVLSQTVNHRQRNVAIIIITLSILALINFILLYPASPFALRLVGGMVLFCFLPGFALLPPLFPRRDSLDYLEALVLSTGLSYALSILVTFTVCLVPGEMTLEQTLLFFDVLIVLMAILGYVRGCVSGHCRLATPFGSSFLIQLVLFIILGFFLRFAFLGYAELQGDEIEVVASGIQAIAGQDDVLFIQRKGPTQFLLAAAFALFTDGAGEFAARSPFALASVLTLVVVVIMGRRLFNKRVGIVAGALLLIEGFASAHARTVQYQYVVLLMITLSVYCAQRFLDAEDDREGGKFFGLAIFFWGIGLLTHYDAILILPVLALAYTRRHGLKWPARSRLPIALGILVTLVALAFFYIPFVTHPHFQSTYEMYSQKKVGLGPFNNLPDFLRIGIFYNSPYYMIVMAFLTVVGWTVALKRALRSKYLAYLFAMLCVIGLLVSTVLPSAFIVGGKSYDVLFFLPAVLVLVFSGKIERKFQVVLVWFFVLFISKAFWELAPGLHYYGFSPAWAIISAVGLEHILNGLDNVIARIFSLRSDSATYKLYRHAGTVLLLVIYGLLAYYHYMLFVQNEPEYALHFPASRHPLYWTPQEERPGMPFFGLPHKAGWKTLASLYTSGTLRGDYETNGRLPRPKWYVQPLPKLTGIPRYFFFDEESALFRPIEKYSKEAVEHFHELIGEVRVNGQSRLLIYEDRRTVPSPVSVQQYDAEDYEEHYDRLFNLETFRLLNRYGHSSQYDFRALGNYLHAAAGKNDAIVFSSGEQPLILNYHYQGDSDYVSLRPSDTITGTLDPGKHPWAFVLWYRGEDDTARQDMSNRLAGYGDLMGTRYFGEAALSLYKAQSSLAEDETVRHLSEATLADSIALLEYQLDRSTLSPGENLSLTLLWQALTPISEDYTVFVHLIRADGDREIRSQVDSQPSAGEEPTLGWTPGRVVVDDYVLSLPPDIPPGKYRLEIGMYDLKTMRRLPVSSPESSDENDKIVLFPTIVVR